MEKLLQWSIAQQTGDKESAEKIGQPDPKLLEQLFGGGGPDEPALMKQSIMVVENPEATLENKQIAFDNFEMLIENLDNANNIENLKLWTSIINQLSPEVDDSLKIYAASIIGTAVQNNPNSQEDFLKYCPQGLSKLIELSNSDNLDLQHKCLFAIASFIRNYEPGYSQFDSLNGWLLISSKLSDLSNHKTNLRVLSILSSILSTGLNDEKINQISNIKLIHHLVSNLHHEGHIGCIDKTLNIISQLASLNYKFSKNEINDLATGLDNVEVLKNEISEDDYNLAKQVVH